MTLTVDLFDETESLTEDHLELVRQLVEKTIEIEQLSGDIEVSISFVDKERIRTLNREYRGRDMPTDVLSFALNEQGEGELQVHVDDLPNVLGDVIISVDHIYEQAKEYGHSFERELGFLTVHGLLHLLGYDHNDEAEEREMFSKQEDILRAYGLTR